MDGSSGVHGDRIARFTNSQNAITERDLRANDAVQTLLQKGFESLGWFYERKEGEWRAVKGTDSNASRGGYKKGRLENDVLAQRALAFWLRVPADAKGRARLIFDEGREGYYNKVFSPDSPSQPTPDDYLIPTLLHKLIIEWRRRWVKAHPVRGRGQRQQLHELVKNADLYMLSILGEVITSATGLEFMAGPGRSLAGVRTLIENATEETDLRKGNPLVKLVFDCLEFSTSQMAEYCDRCIAGDPTLTPRKVLIRRPTFDSPDFRDEVRSRIIKTYASKFASILGSVADDEASALR